MIIICMECFSPVDEEKVDEVGMVQCQCGLKVVREDEALTIVSEMPLEEYLGG